MRCATTLLQRGHKVEVRGPWSMNDSAGIVVDQVHNTLLPAPIRGAPRWRWLGKAGTNSPGTPSRGETRCTLNPGSLNPPTRWAAIPANCNASIGRPHGSSRPRACCSNWLASPPTCESWTLGLDSAMWRGLPANWSVRQDRSPESIGPPRRLPNPAARRGRRRTSHLVHGGRCQPLVFE